MKVAAFLCLLLAGSQALDCQPGNNFFEQLLCSIGTAAKQVGTGLLDSLKGTAIQAATQLGGQLITGLQTVAHAAQNATLGGLIGKREVDLATILKIAAFAESHRVFVEDLGHLMQNISQFTLNKLDGLIKQYQGSPSAELLTKIEAYLRAHNLLQDALLKWIGANSNPMTAFVAREALALAFHKRSDPLQGLAQLSGQISASFEPLAESLKTLVGGLGGQLVHLLPQASDLLHQVQPADVEGAVSSAVSDLLHQTAMQGSPDLLAILLQVGQSLL